MASEDVKPIRRCRKCHMPMKGHKADTCLALVAQQGAGALFPVTPPATPENANNAHPRTAVHLEIGVSRHWRDPEWASAVVHPPALALGGHGSDVEPTVLVDDDGNTIPGRGATDRGRAASASGSRSDSNSDASPIRSSGSRRRPKTPLAQALDQAHALSLCDPVLSIVRVSLADLPRMQATAGQCGLCTSIVRMPWGAPRFREDASSSSSFAGLGWRQLGDAEEDSKDGTKVWVVVGDDPALVQRTAELQQRYERVPGAIKDDVVVVQATYRSVFFASVVSALVVLLGMSILV